MSLKGFHILFIAVSVLLTLGFALWCLTGPQPSQDPVIAGMGYGSAVGSAVLVVYGIWFLRKARRIIV